MRLQVTWGVLVAFVLAGCGGDSASRGPTQPSSGSPSYLSITITSPGENFYLGETHTFTAQATLAGGTTQALSTGFQSDTPSVATVTPAGAVTVVGIGEANIYIVAGGVQGQKRIRTFPSFQGNWVGSYSITECSATGDFQAAGMCSSTFQLHTVLPTTMQFVQTRDQVTGTTNLGSIRLNSATGPVSGVTLTLDTTGVSGTFDFIVNWRLTSTQKDRITGEIAFLIRGAAYRGEARVRGAVFNTNRVTASSAPARTRSVGDLRDLFEALTEPK
jgi:hypothetical protein